jgi:uncharacterized protein (TIGR00369 family)
MDAVIDEKHYLPLVTPPGFVQFCGGVHVHEHQPIVAVRIRPEHLNSVHIAHGGFLATVADSAFGIILRRVLGTESLHITVSLNIDYLGAVREGEWLEAHVDVLKSGGSFANASCLLKVADRLVLRASGVFTPWKTKT